MMKDEDLVNLIHSLRDEKAEGEYYEFKKSYLDSEKFGRSISALSNSAALCDQKYGYIIFGIDDTTHDIIGTNYDSASEKAKGNVDLVPWLEAGLIPKINVVYRVLFIDDKRLFVVIIDAAKERPTRIYGKEYIRIQSYNQPLAEYGNKEKELWKKLTLTPFEEDIALQNCSSDEVLSYIDYPAFFTLLNLPLPDAKDGILKRLVMEGVINSNGVTYNILNIGALLFGRDLKTISSVSRKTVRIILYERDDRIDAKKEVSFDSGYAISFEKIIAWIDDQLPASEFIGDSKRKEIKIYPKVAIREFVANALIHQDFWIRGAGPMIEIFQSRMEISNPGIPLIKIDRFIDHTPVSRNEKIASLMRRMNFCEERGSGVDRAISKIEEFQLPAPEFSADDDFTRIILYANLKSMGTRDRIRACYQHCCLCWVRKEYMTNTTLRERLGISKGNYSVASRIIRDTLNENLIKIQDPEGEGRGPKRKYLPYWG